MKMKSAKFGYKLFQKGWILKTKKFNFYENVFKNWNIFEIFIKYSKFCSDFSKTGL